MDYSDSQSRQSRYNPVKGMGGVSTEYATAGIVIGCLIALIFIRRGFRSLKVPGVGSVNVG